MPEIEKNLSSSVGLQNKVDSTFSQKLLRLTELKGQQEAKYSAIKRTNVKEMIGKIKKDIKRIKLETDRCVKEGGLESSVSLRKWR